MSVNRLGSFFKLEYHIHDRIDRDWQEVDAAQVDTYYPPMRNCVQLMVLSITVDVPCPYTTGSEISLILDNLPSSCTSLELDIRRGSCIFDRGSNVNHDDQARQSCLCNSTRAVLPRLQHLCLRLPTLCPAIFSNWTPDQQANHRVTRATMLITCVINLCQGKPDQCALKSSLCGGDRRQIPFSFSRVLPVLRDFARLNSANMERLWVIDLQNRDLEQNHSWPGCVRRDVISGTSFPIPTINIGVFGSSGWFARVPASTDPETTQDWVLLPTQFEMVVEGNTWVETHSGARLPMAKLRKHSDMRIALTGEEFIERGGFSFSLWANEKIVGQHILPKGPGELMKHWNLSEMTPDGWTRNPGSGSPLRRIRR